MPRKLDECRWTADRRDSLDHQGSPLDHGGSGSSVNKFRRTRMAPRPAVRISCGRHRKRYHDSRDFRGCNAAGRAPGPWAGREAYRTRIFLQYRFHHLRGNAASKICSGSSAPGRRRTLTENNGCVQAAGVPNTNDNRERDGWSMKLRVDMHSARRSGRVLPLS